MKVLNFGSINIDHVYEVDDFVKKGETISSYSLNTFCGGKGFNQSLALARAGVPVYHAGSVGEDGEDLIDILKDNQVDVSFIRKLKDIPTGHAIIQLNKENDNCILLYSGANYKNTRAYVDEVLSGFEKDDILLIQNEINELSYLVEKANEKGMKIVLNPSPMNEKIQEIELNKIWCFILNEHEAKSLLRTESSENEEIIKELGQKYPKHHIVLTLGEEGSVYVHGDETVHQSAYKVEVVDTTAAGDTFTGYYLSGMINGKSVKESMDLAARASALAVTKKGAEPSIPYFEDVLSLISK